MKTSRLEGDKKKKGNNIIKDIRNLFRLKKDIDNTIIKYIRNLFTLTKEN